MFTEPDCRPPLNAEVDVIEQKPDHTPAPHVVQLKALKAIERCKPPRSTTLAAIS